ncbi:DUF805 domain-containing protein [Microvirga flavescens]|uniref:DUF805 domain-containing protein n=1 Tax=Microvirga flavescens TaxID=2249811 RepID=UPI000DD64A4F|nr:DUF805 domain-containing protein [Microvirga flavescens]
MKQFFDFMLWLFFSPKGRIGRAQWWISSLVLISLSISPWLISSLHEKFEEQYFIPVLSFGLAMIYPAYAVDAKRFQDRDRSGFWALFGVIFTLLMSKELGLLALFGVTKAEMSFLVWAIWGLALVYFFVLAFLQGSVGRNRYGAEPATDSIFRVPAT